MSAADGRRVVLTYGTFDLFHEGHKRLLERARALGDILIVGVTTEAYDDARGKLNVQQSLMDRVKNVEASGLADQVIIEEYDGQKVTDIQKHGVDTFAIGSDWLGKFDYLRDYCEVVYLERTKGVSSTQRRAEESGVLRIGVIGTGRIAARFVAEARYVSGVDVIGAWSRSSENVAAFAAAHELQYAATDVEELIEASDAVYVATPHPSHDDYVELALKRGKHVLCEKPVSLSAEAAQRLFDQAEESGLVLLEAIKTAFCPGFERLVALARSGVIGEVRSVDAAFSKLADPTGREFDAAQGGGSISELASYPLLAIAKLLGTDHREVSATVWQPEGEGVDLFGTVEVVFPKAVATARVGLGVKVEGHLVVGGTQGTLYAPAPWWLTTHFDVRYEDPRRNKSFYHPFEGDGLRYEIAEFTSMIRRGQTSSYKLRPSESVWIASVIESARASARTFG